MGWIFLQAWFGILFAAQLPKDCLSTKRRVVHTLPTPSHRRHHQHRFVKETLTCETYLDKAKVILGIDIPFGVTNSRSGSHKLNASTT
jgi:hypothetical protein